MLRNKRQHFEISGDFDRIIIGYRRCHGHLKFTLQLLFLNILISKRDYLVISIKLIGNAIRTGSNAPIMYFSPIWGHLKSNTFMAKKHPGLF